MKQVEFFGMAFFIPAFLVSVGMLINPAVLFSIQTLLLAAAFMVALTVGKLVASLIAGRLFKYSRPEMGVMFSLTITQAAATLATVMVGTKIGLLEDDIVNAVLLVVIVSLVATSIGTRFFTSKIKPEKVDVPPIGESVIVPVFPSTRVSKPVIMSFNERSC
jgi:Kef-type K+ transport system membrane component KefB